LNDLFGSNCPISSAALGIKKTQQLLQRSGIGRVSQKGTFPLHTHQVLILEFFEVVGKSRIWDVQLFLYIADYKPVRVRGKQQLHDSQPRLGPHGGQHVREFGDLIQGLPVLWPRHISIIAEI